MSISFRIAPKKGDRSAAKFDVVQNGKVIASDELRAKDVETILENMIRVRAKLLPEISRDYPIGRKFNAEYDPVWYTEPEKLTEGSALFIRHPGLGWLAFVFPREAATKIRDFLSKQIERPQQDKSKPN